MKKFIKENRLKIISMLVIIIGIFVYFFGYFLPQKNQLAIADLQEKCATQAHITLKDFANSNSLPPSSSSLSQKNHYNQKLNKCFVLIDNFNPLSSLVNPDSVSNPPSSSEFLFDAYENSNLANCIFYAFGADPSKQPLCSILNNGVASEKEYTDFINQQMEINK